jgi:hypothetical protein
MNRIRTRGCDAYWRIAVHTHLREEPDEDEDEDTEEEDTDDETDDGEGYSE